MGTTEYKADGMEGLREARMREEQGIGSREQGIEIQMRVMV